jgi:hypothetical protein
MLTICTPSQFPRMEPGRVRRCASSHILVYSRRGLTFSLQRAAEVLYHDIENLELYVGLLAEETKQPGSGAGLCPGYTLSRAILSDAVCLTRGDRFLTTEFTRARPSLVPLPDAYTDASPGQHKTCPHGATPTASSTRGTARSAGC